ncbi:MAG: cellulose biosynthesis cyclic di-GMP-binding regulatory protein BcsB [Deltaproteobacteria bacterium]|nr:cellulose biosynthesis cyclic di-GMP-binding regulatory protein BcsB [Deltaproteobacteria bacterium]
MALNAPTRALVTLITWAALGASAAQAKDDEAENRVVDIGFADDLYRPYDVKLKGITAYETVGFPRPKSWELVADPELHIHYTHSETLLSERSNLTVLLNDSQVGSVNLGPDNVDSTEMVLALPVENLDHYNFITFAATQHLNEEWEDPFDPSLWTRVSHTSFIRFTYEPEPVEPELSTWPFPFYDDLGYGPLEVTLVGPDKVSIATIEALARLSMSLGRIAGYRGVQVHPPVYTVEAAETPALVMGTISENPEIERLVDVSMLKTGEGLVAVVPNPADPSLPVLVVTGTTVQSVESAVVALASDTTTQMLAGRQSVVYEVLNGGMVPNDRKPRPVHGLTTFTMEEIGVDDATVRGFYAPAVRIPIRLEGDAQVLRFGAWASIRYGYSAQLDTEISNMEIRLNGVTIDSAALRDPEGAERLTHRVRLPAQVITPHSILEVVFNLFPAGYDIRHPKNDRMLWATVYSDTEIHIPRDRYAWVPDLARLRYDAWPFTLEPGSGSTTLVLADRPTRADASAALELGAYLGYASMAEEPDLQVTVSSPKTSGLPLGRHAILLVGDRDHSTYKRLVTEGLAGAMTRAGGPLADADAVAMSEVVDATSPTVEEFIDPADPNRLRLVLKAPVTLGLLDLVDQISDPAEVARLEGNVAVFEADEGIKTVTRGAQTRFGNPSLGGRVQAFRWEEHWVALGSTLVFLLFLAAVAIRAWARRREGEIE